MNSEISTPSTDGFSGSKLNPKLIETLVKLGFKQPTPIQQAAIDPLLAGRDFIGQAATGTGKTAAFALPIIQKLMTQEGPSARPSALVLVPTRELAIQVTAAIQSFGSEHGVKSVAIYGGQSYDPQIRALERGVDIVVATPGRAIDHIDKGTLKLGTIETVVLDEADEMLDMGFVDDIERILKKTSAKRQVVMFSATLPSRVNAIARKHQKDPVKVSIARPVVAAGEEPNIRQVVYFVQPHQRLAALSRILEVEAPTAALIFCRTRSEVDEINDTLTSRGLRVEALHGGISQQLRERVIHKLKTNRIDLVVATDVAARGLDIDHLTHVVNLEIPGNAETYVHRIGRVGRAGRSGTALTLCSPRDSRLIRNIEYATKQKVEIATLPSVTDLKAKRLEQTTTKIRAALEEKKPLATQPILEALTKDYDLETIALTVLSMIHEGTGSVEDLKEIKPVNRSMDSSSRPQRDMGRPSRDRDFSPPPRQFHNSEDMTRLHINLGRNDGIRPKDLVGAIAGESGISGRSIGDIKISDTFSLVEVPKDSADIVMNALKTAKIKGKSARARTDIATHN